MIMEKNNTITREEAAVSGIKDVYTPSHQVQGQVEAAQLYLGEYLVLPSSSCLGLPIT